MLTNKTLNANVDPSAIGGTYTWSAESCTCTSACADVSFTSTTGTVIGTNFSTTVTYPDDCTSIIIKLTIITIEGEEQCVSTFFYNIVNELGGTQLTWSCESNEVGCVQIPSENQIFETAYDCLNCTTCPCSTSNVCQDATFQAAYDCITHELTITSANQLSWCTVPYPTIETVNIVLNYTQGTYTHAETVNLACNTALPLVIDLTANPLPQGVYFVEIIMQLNGCQVLVNSLFVNCPSGGGGDVYNIDCCIGQITGSAQANQQNNPPVVYTYHFNTPLTQDIIIDLDTAQIVDKLSVFSTWNNTLLTGTEIATTNYIGHCGECCNTQYHPYTVGYFERNYNSATPTPPVDSPHRTCNNGTYTGGTTPVPGGFSYGGYLDFGKARLVLTPTYVNSLGLVDNILYIVMYNNGTANTYDEFGNLTCSCNTVWSFRVKCDDNCPCVETGTPEIVILPKVCEVSSGGLTIVSPCYSGYGHMQWSLDGITWIEGEPIYVALPGITGVTQTLFTRCISDTDYSCYGDVTQTPFSKPDCCSGLLEYTVECNPITDGIYNQTDYRFRVVYYIPSCDDTENPNIVSPLYGSPEDNDYQYIVGFDDNAVTVEVYFNETSPYFFSIACNICQTPVYWASNNEDIHNAISNLLITHACEPCDIELTLRNPAENIGTTLYISLDDINGTLDLPAISQGQPPYTLLFTKNGLPTTAGISVWYNTSPITTLTPNISSEYTITGYLPGGNTNLNYGVFFMFANPGEYNISITDNDNCIANIDMCSVEAEIINCPGGYYRNTYANNISNGVGDTFEGVQIGATVYPCVPPINILSNTNQPNLTLIQEFLDSEVAPLAGGTFIVSFVNIEPYPCTIDWVGCYDVDLVMKGLYKDVNGILQSTTGITTIALSVNILYVLAVPGYSINSYNWILDPTLTTTEALTSQLITITGSGNASVIIDIAGCGIGSANISIS